ncbi:MAG: DNA repair protein RecO [Chitinophagaceae bacterium]|nr:DNA repair protein RecO [Chitinophagaceae bacterium]
MSGTVLHTTKGIILRAVKYGETSLILTVYTSLFGTQSYLINGLRSSSKNGNNKAAFFQPASLLELVVYHNEFKNLQRIKEYRWSHLYQHLFFDVRKNCVALFMIELLQKTLKQPDPHPELFEFLEDAFIHLDEANDTIVANFPLFFATQLMGFFGFRISDDHDNSFTIFDLAEGAFVKEPPSHSHYINEAGSILLSHLLKVMHPSELVELNMNVEKRRTLLQALQIFYTLHIPEFGTMRTLPVLQEVLG